MKQNRLIKKTIAGALIVSSIISSSYLYTPLNLVSSCYAASQNEDDPEPPSSNYTGFVSKGTNKYYFDNGILVLSKTKKIEGKIYLFDSNGKLMVNGIHTVKKNKYYSDKDGIVTCNDWIKMKDGSYYYASSSGKLKKYQFVKEKSAYFSDPSFKLYINDKEADVDELKINNNTKDFFLKLNKDYYPVSCTYSGGVEIISETGLYIYEGNAPIYDAATGKNLGTFYGKYNIDSKTQRINRGKLFNSKDNKVYTFNKNKSQPSVTKASPFIIYYRGCPHNSVGGMGYYMSCYNNSKKTIKYVYLDVYVLNAVNDVVECDITGKLLFNLQLTGPVGSHETRYAECDAFMYNNSAKKVKISGVTIEYMNGSKVTLKPSEFEFCEIPE